MRFSISHLKDHLTCPVMAHNRHVVLRGLPGASRALEVGTLVHKALEARANGAPEWWDVVPLDDFGRPQMRDDSVREYEALVPLLKSWTPDPDWKLHGVELVLEAPIGGHVLVGTLDGLVKWNGQWWSLQYKTCSERENPLTLIEKVRLGFHECAYQYLAEYNDYKPFGGTLLQMFRKVPKGRLVLTDELLKKRVEYTPEERAQLAVPPTAIVSRSREELDERLSHIELLANDMDHNNEYPHHMVKNTYACWGAFGNSKCAYYSVCHEGASLNEHPFVTLEDRYATP